jgi:hypothetical protein
MKITREQLKGIVRGVMKEESEYQTFFKKALEKTGKSIPDMSDEEKKDFFNKIDSAWNAKGEKNEELTGNQHKLDVDGDGEIEASDLAKLRAGKKKDESVNEASRYLAKKDAEHLIHYLSGKKVKDILSFVFQVYNFKSDKAKKEMAQAFVKYQDGVLDKKGLENALFDIDKKYGMRESVNEDIKIGSSVMVNYPNLKKPIHGKVKYTAKAPTGMVYILDGDKGVWDAKYVSLKETVKEGEDLDIGHTDDEPNMLKSTAFELAQYGAKLVQKLDQYDKMPQEVDFPNWWQAKLILAKDYVQGAYDYLDSKETLGEGRAFVSAAKKAKQEGKTEFEFNGKKYPVTIKD